LYVFGRKDFVELLVGVAMRVSLPRIGPPRTWPAKSGQRLARPV